MANPFKDKKAFLKLWFGVMIFIATFGIFMLLASGPDSPYIVVKRFISICGDHNWDIAESLWSRAGKEHLISQGYHPRSWIEKTMKDLLPKNLEGVNVTEREVNTDKAKVFAIMFGSDGTRERAEFTLIKEDGEWKLYSIREP